MIPRDSSRDRLSVSALALLLFRRFAFQFVLSETRFTAPLGIDLHLAGTERQYLVEGLR
jgi:hypothetical protein